jgi:hypothetical protein
MLLDGSTLRNRFLRRNHPRGIGKMPIHKNLQINIGFLTGDDGLKKRILVRKVWPEF